VITAVNTGHILAEVYFFLKVQCGKMLKLPVIQNKFFTLAGVIERIFVWLGKHLLKSCLKGTLLHVFCSLLGKKEIISNYLGTLGCLSAQSCLCASLYPYVSLLPSKPDFCCTSELSRLLYSLQRENHNFWQW